MKPQVHTLITNLVDKLFEAEDRRLNAAIADLNRRNRQLHDVRVDGFLYAGQFYLPRSGTLTVAGQGQRKLSLHASLHGDMLRHMQDRNLVSDEKSRIAQSLGVLLRPCRDVQEMRDTLPECLVNCVPGFTGLSRRNEIAFTIRENPRAFRQFTRILPTMEVYSAARLIY